MAIVNTTAPLYAQTPKINAATGSAAAFTFFGPVPYACVVTAINFIQGTQSSSTAALNLFKDSGTQAPGGGTSLLVGGTALVSSAIANNTLTACSLNAASAGLTLAAGDRLSFQLTSTLTALENAIASVTLSGVSA